MLRARPGDGHGHRVGLLLENRPAFLLHWFAQLTGGWQRRGWLTALIAITILATLALAAIACSGNSNAPSGNSNNVSSVSAVRAWSKLLMMAEEAISLIVAVLVVARAVSILK